MKKLLYLIIFMVSILAVLFITFQKEVKEIMPDDSISIVDSVTTAVVGHVEDAVSRFTDDEIIEYKFLVKEGTFDETADGQDFAHWAKGSVSIVQTLEGKSYVQLNPDFDSGPLPDGHVFISFIDKDINNESDFNFKNQIDLGKLKKGSGASYYEIPEHLPVSLVKSVTIWCLAFSEYIGSADVD